MITPTNLLQKMGEIPHTIVNAKKETLQSVATAIGITYPVLSKIENGRHDHLSISTLIYPGNYYSVPFNKHRALRIFQLLEHQQGRGS